MQKRNFKETVGIDVSKDVLDVTLHLAKLHHQFSNNLKGFRELLKWIKAHSGYPLEQVLICFEHTGIYSLPLATFLSENKIAYVMESSLQIKRSLGIARGKNDKIDSRRIAQYAYMRRDSLKIYQLPSASLQKLQELLSLRERLVKQRSGFKSALKSQKQMLTRKNNPLIFSVQEKMIEQLSIQIKAIEKEMKSIIEADPELKSIYKLVISVKGIGFIIGTHLLVNTQCFTKFENARQYACYCGVAPFEHSSGKSIRGKTRVSHFANKKMKYLFDLAAQTAIQNDPELKYYYESRVEKGKSKRSVLNAVRNKLIHRVFAVVKRGTPFVPLFRPNVAA
jgi:transposase